MAHLADDSVVVIKSYQSGLRLFVDVGDMPIGPAIFEDRFERSEIAFACRAVRPGQIAIDVGAHVGLFAVHMAARVGGAGHVYAVEPMAAQTSLLDRSLAENDVAARVTVIRAAAGRDAGRRHLCWGPGPNRSAAFVLPRNAAMTVQEAGYQRAAVPVIRLDDVDVCGRVGFMKLDVNGAELDVLAGADRLLTHDRPVVLCKVDYAQLARVSGATPDDLFRRLVDVGYEACDVRADGGAGSRLAHPPTARVAHVAFLPRAPGG